MKYFDYSNSSELKKIQRYFTQEEWEIFCEGLKKFDKEFSIPSNAAEKWIKGFPLDDLKRLEYCIDGIFAVCEGIDRLFRDRVVVRIKQQNTLN